MSAQRPSLLKLNRDAVIRREFFGGLVFLRRTDVILEVDRGMYSFLESLPLGPVLLSRETWHAITPLIDNEVIVVETVGLSPEARAERIHLPHEPDPDRPLGRNWLSVPTVLTIEITDACNMSCIHCYQRGYHGQRYLSMEDYERLVSELAGLRCFSVALLGGEPLLHPEIREMVDLGLGLGVNVRVSTNGLLVDDSFARFAAAREPLLRIQLSLDASNDLENASLRGVPDGVSRVVRAGRYLANRGVTVNIGSTLSPANPEAPKKIARLCASEGFDYLHFSPMMPLSSCRDSATMGLQVEARKTARAELSELAGEFEDEISIEFSEMVVNPESLKAAYPNLSSTDRAFGLCGAGKTRGTITPSGVLLPCDILRTLDCGNVLTDGFKDVWEHSELLKSLRGRAKFAKGTCRECSVFSYCEGECPQYSMIRSGYFLDVEPVCGCGPV